VTLKRWETAKAKVSHRKAQAKYQKDPIQVQKRENRNLARAHMIHDGKAHKGDGKDVEHKNGNALDNNPKNWAIGSRKANRSYARNKDGSKKDPRS